MNSQLKAPHRLPALLRLPEVRSLTGLSTTEIYRRISASRFPKQVPLGAKTSAWSSLEIDEWIAARIAERDSIPPRPSPNRLRSTAKSPA